MTAFIDSDITAGDTVLMLVNCGPLKIHQTAIVESVNTFGWIKVRGYEYWLARDNVAVVRERKPHE